MLTALAYLALVAWVAVAIASAPSVYLSLRGLDRREGDPARLLTLSFGAMMCGFIGRRLWFPDSEEGLMALFAISIGIALLTLLLMRSYGRGRRV